MAGMLPGVEAARRRRVHQSCGCSSLGINTSSYSPSRRSSFSLYSSSSSSTSFSAQPRSSTCTTYQDDEKLGPLAREAKERLDGKLRSQRKPIFTRNNTDHLRSSGVNGNVKNETPVCDTSSGAKRSIIGWAKLGWRSGEQHECGVCF